MNSMPEVKFRFEGGTSNFQLPPTPSPPLEEVVTVDKQFPDPIEADPPVRQTG